MYTCTDLRLPLDLIRGCPPEEEDCPNCGSYVQKLKTNINKIHESARKNIFSPPNMRKQPMTEHPDMPSFKNNRKFGCIILTESKEGLRSAKAIGKDLIRLSRSSMMSFFASRRHQNTKRRSFILIDWQPITIGNFFCSTHGYFEP